MSFAACLHTFLLGIHPGVKLLSHRTCNGSTLEDGVKQFYKMVVPLFILTSAYESSICSTSSLTVGIASLVNFSLSSGFIVVFHCGFLKWKYS